MVCFAWQMSFDDPSDLDLTSHDLRLSRESNRNNSDFLKIGSNPGGGKETRTEAGGAEREWGGNTIDKRVGWRHRQRASGVVTPTESEWGGELNRERVAR